VRKLIPIAFATLTAPNLEPGTHRDEILSAAGEHLVGGDGVVGTYQFIQRIGFATNTHIASLIGYERTRNIHSHLILHIPEDEQDRFLSRLLRVDRAALYGGRRHLHFELYDGDRGSTYSYVGGKHTPWALPTVCPGYYSRCRKGLCEWDKVLPDEVAEYRDLTHTAHHK
jgi:hypothetical protein